MENMNMQNAPPPPPLGGGQMPPPIPQLPPQMFTTAAQLLDLTDKKLMVSLRDGRKLIGVLRSWDQFGNLVLQDTVERLFAQNLYADVDRGLFLVRGENVLLLGEIVRSAFSYHDSTATDVALQDLDRDDYVPPTFQQAPLDQVFELHKQEQAQKKKQEKMRHKKLAAYGFEGEHSGEAIL
ncbi:Sm-like ribonucleo protein [Aureobasidium pullulans]|uniref:U6 snRNA-associated Sm-like protein LSm1 n=1 Tax=Aureobasidium pullulans TaxID=5580 RepID=A0A4S9CGL1_AURPU|nr:Sm-like ribonucleo protein [Aureobasidium pullulans]THW36946.1 Sm-like ribonucleo protein [Aureobasidium pullulans]THW95018.1 Sm-like ribonucleo protein [Aureobasidium pullulans]THX06105.1 Sm-like ribonucleo protein [Aureobasidium pullulans]THY04059.1 Sm-like ribonucleo protein [Aureobasidium pullulans]